MYIYIFIYIYLLYTLSTSHEQKNTLLMLQIFALKVAGRLSIDPMWVLRQVSYMPAPCAALSALTTVRGVARLPVREKLNKLHHGSDIIIIKVEYEVIMKTPSKKIAQRVCEIGSTSSIPGNFPPTFGKRLASSTSKVSKGMLSGRMTYLRMVTVLTEETKNELLCSI